MTRSEGRLDGWLVLDKPFGVLSSRAVSLIRRATGVKVGHAGTLDPLATGILPLALGEATKTASCALSARKRYRFTVRWGISRATDDAEGEIAAESPVRPDREAIECVLPRFVGIIQQIPPDYSAIHVAGKRAYSLARAEKPVELAARPVEIAGLRLIEIPDRDHAVFEALVGKGAYIRALARDMARALGTLAYVSELRRLSVGRFDESRAISLDFALEHAHILAECGCLLPIETALDDIPALSLTAAEASRLCHGQFVTPGGQGDLSRFAEGTLVGALSDRLLIALARVGNGGLRPVRILNR